jgi:hypothetical protein
MLRHTVMGLWIAILSSTAFAESGAVPISKEGDIALEEFEGCQVKPPKDGCSARISCIGEASILFNDSRGVREAAKIADLNARKRMAQFFNDKIKAQEELKQAESASKKEGPQGAQTSREISRLMAEVTASSAEALLQGVVTLGRTVDAKAGIVYVEKGQSCKSKQAAAQAAQVVGPQQGSGAAGAGAAAATGGPQMYEGEVNSSRRRAKNAEDF